MTGKDKQFDLTEIMRSQWLKYPLPPEGLLEQRVLELEHLGLRDIEDIPGEPSMVRQFAIASLLHEKPPYFVTFDDDLLGHRELLHDRYGMEILSIFEALMLLRETDGPPN